MAVPFALHLPLTSQLSPNETISYLLSENDGGSEEERIKRFKKKDCIFSSFFFLVLEFERKMSKQ